MTQSLEKRSERINYILSRNTMIHGHEFHRTKYGEEIILTYKFASSIEIDAYQIETDIMALPCMSLYGIKRENNRFCLGNISGHQSKGYGTVVLNKLIKYCIENEIHEIYGELSYHDLESNKERLLNFYKSVGAKYQIDANTNNGTMSLNLKSTC